MSRRRITFVSHDASRTGAPMLLADLVAWLVAEGLVEANFVLLRGGPLEDRFAAIGPTRVVEPSSRRATLGALGRGLGELGATGTARRLDRGLLRHALAGAGSADLVWLSAAPSLVALGALPAMGIGRAVPAVSHIHELGGLLDEVFTPAELRDLLRRSDGLVVGAQSVAGALEAAGAEASRIRICDEFIPDVATPPRAGGDAVERRRAELGIPSGALVVGAMATASQRKGIDLFVLLARMLRDRMPPAPEAHLLWVGGHDDDIELAEARADAARAGLADRIHFVGEQTDLEAWFALFDVFALTSREDSFPLVCLHAGIRGIPVVAFDTGVGDLLARAGDEASAVPDRDLRALADRVAALLADPAERTAVGARLAAAVRARHVTDVAAPAIWSTMQELAGWH